MSYLLSSFVKPLGKMVTLKIDNTGNLYPIKDEDLMNGFFRFLLQEYPEMDKEKSVTLKVSVNNNDTNKDGSYNWEGYLYGEFNPQ